MNIQKHLSQTAKQCGIAGKLTLPDAEIDPGSIRVVFINEAPPADPKDYFYSGDKSPADLKTAIPLLQGAGYDVNGMEDILRQGFYITTAVKAPKDGYAVETETVKAHLPLLEEELRLFPHLAAVMLMGDVAKKAFNLIAKKETGKNAIPTGSTYKLRKHVYLHKNLRVFPSYIMTGGNLLIEKSKVTMIQEDLGVLRAYLSGVEG